MAFSVISLCFCSYAALIADWPVVVLGMCTVFIVVCALVGVLVPELPDFSDPLLVRKTEPIESAHLVYLAFDHLKRLSILGHFVLCYLVPSLLKPSQAISKYSHFLKEERLVCILRFSKAVKELAHLQKSGNLFLGLHVKLKSCKLENLQTIKTFSQNL